MTKDNDNILFLIKFGKRKHLNSLLNDGQLHFSNPKKFNDIKDVNDEQGDENEGAFSIENMKSARLTSDHPVLGKFILESVPGKMSKMTRYYSNYLTCSFYIISQNDFKNSNYLTIDPRMLSSFGEYALIIGNPGNFIKRIIEYANREDLKLITKGVEYKDLGTEGRIEINPFIKKVEHSYQKEYRIVIQDCPESSKTLRINEIGINGIISRTEQLKEIKIDYT